MTCTSRDFVRLGLVPLLGLVTSSMRQICSTVLESYADAPTHYILRPSAGSFLGSCLGSQPLCLYHNYQISFKVGMCHPCKFNLFLILSKLSNIITLVIILLDRPLNAIGWWYRKVKIVQECKELKVEMYKLIWGLMVKCNGSGIRFK
jgi:hypothetical protein